MASGVRGVTGDFATPPPPWKVQRILADRGEEDTSCRPVGFSALLCAFSPACDLEAFQGGARRTLVPVPSSLRERVKRVSSRSEDEQDDDCGGNDGERNMGVVLKKWISCPRFCISILSSLLSLVAPSDGSSCGCHLKERGGNGAVRAWLHHRTFSCN